MIRNRGIFPKLASGSIQCRLKSKASSQIWLKRQEKDLYVKKAKENGYLCRSAFKLLEINQKFNLLTPGSAVVDCGASPGSWTQVAVSKVIGLDPQDRKGVVVSVDLQDIRPIVGAAVLGCHDFTLETTKQKIRLHLPNGNADVVLSDMAPPSTGNHRMDHDRIMDLAFDFFDFAQSVLSPNGSAVCKLSSMTSSKDSRRWPTISRNQVELNQVNFIYVH